ncbi:unnamed protein product [Soboliphyme baturini]|uniref:RRM domain-containing protein n=1 Tax=Soboliphyme baturini TaxID=241478 RepID=A0A183IIH4_9BILA|nr:unnamed protein product [Soboliphyme baturini]
MSLQLCFAFPGVSDCRVPHIINKRIRVKQNVVCPSFSSFAWSVNDRKSLHSEYGFITMKEGTNIVALTTIMNNGNTYVKSLSFARDILLLGGKFEPATSLPLTLKQSCSDLGLSNDLTKAN